MKQWAIAAAVALLCLPTYASASYVGLFMDPAASTCAANVGPQAYQDLYLVAVLDGEVGEATGFQLQITGMPSGWNPSNVLWVPDNGVTISLGHPMFTGSIYHTSGGLNIAFNTCTSSMGERIVLGRLVLLGAPTPDNVTLTVVPVNLVPSDPDCIIATTCDASYAKICVGGGSITLNGDGTQGGGCQVAVEEATWSSVRQLYR